MGRRARLRTSLSALLAGAVVLLGVVVVPAVVAPVAAAATAVTFTASEDTFVDAGSPDRNHGGAAALSASPSTHRVLLRFAVALPPESTVTGVRLRTYANATVSGRLVVHPSTGLWSETTVTARTQPPWDAAELGRSGALQRGQYASATLPVSAVPTGGAVSLGLDLTSEGRASIASRESSRAPQLVVTYVPAAPPPRPVLSVQPLVETEGFSGSGDVSDDAAIWVDPVDPANSLVIADDKSDPGGGVGVFDMGGSRLSFRAEGAIGNIDLRGGFPMTGGPVVLVAANDRTTNTLALWVLDPVTRALSPVSARSIATVAPNYGSCLYRSRTTGKSYAFVTPRGAGSIQQFELTDTGAGTVDAVLVRTLPVSSITESCVADDDDGQLYVGQEDVAIWKYGAEPSAGAARTSVDAVGAGHLVADIEGMAIAHGAAGAGHLLVSSQGDSTIAVYDRAGGNAFIRSVRVDAAGSIDGVTGTDGLDATTANAGPGFETGLLVVHDSVNSGGSTSNLKYVPLGAVVAPAP